MGKNRSTRGENLAGAFRAGSGRKISKVFNATVSVNPASLAATTKAGTAVTVTGVAVGDLVVVEPPAALEDDLIFCGARVTGADEVTVYLYNPTGGAIDAAAANWDFRVIKTGA